MIALRTLKALRFFLNIWDGSEIPSGALWMLCKASLEHLGDETSYVEPCWPYVVACYRQDATKKHQGGIRTTVKSATTTPLRWLTPLHQAARSSPKSRIIQSAFPRSNFHFHFPLHIQNLKVVYPGLHTQEARRIPSVACNLRGRYI